MNQDLGQQMALRNNTLVSSDTPSIQPQCANNRNDKCQNYSQSTRDSQICDKNRPRTSQSRSNPTNTASGRSKAHSLSQTSSQGFDFNADPLARPSLGSDQHHSAPPTYEAFVDEHRVNQPSANELQPLLGSVQDRSSLQEKFEGLTSLRRFDQRWTAGVKQLLRRATRGRAAMAKKVGTSKQEAKQCKESFDAELAVCKAEHQAQLADVEVKLTRYAFLQRQQDEQKQNLEKEVQELKQENMGLQEINAQLIKGEVPILNIYHARRAGWINTTVQQYATTDTFSWKTTRKAEALCTKVLDDFATAHNSIKPQSLLKSCQDTVQICSESRSKLYNVNEDFDARYQKRIKKMDRLITQEEASHFMIQIKMNACEDTLQVLRKQRQESLKESVALLEYLFRKFFADLTANDGKDWTLYNDEYEEVLEELERLEIPK